MMKMENDWISINDLIETKEGIDSRKLFSMVPHAAVNEGGEVVVKVSELLKFIESIEEVSAGILAKILGRKRIKFAEEADKNTAAANKSEKGKSIPIRIAARKLSLEIKEVIQLIGGGELEGHLRGKGGRVEVSSLEAYMDNHQIKPKPKKGRQKKKPDAIPEVPSDPPDNADPEPAKGISEDHDTVPPDCSSSQQTPDNNADVVPETPTQGVSQGESDSEKASKGNEKGQEDIVNPVNDSLEGQNNSGGEDPDLLIRKKEDDGHEEDPPPVRKKPKQTFSAERTSAGVIEKGGRIFPADAEQKESMSTSQVIKLPVKDGYCSPEDIARAIGPHMPVQTVREWFLSSKITGVRASGNTIRIKPESIKTWLERTERPRTVELV